MSVLPLDVQGGIEGGLEWRVVRTPCEFRSAALASPFCFAKGGGMKGSSSEGLLDGVNYAFDVVGDFVVPESEDSVAFSI